MRRRSPRILSYMALVGAGVACGSSSSPGYLGFGDASLSGDDSSVTSSGGGSGGSSGSSSGNGSASGGSSGSSSGSGGMCPSTCNMDSDCQACGTPPSGGSNCCEAASGMCYQASSNPCPPPSDAGHE